MFLGFDPIRFDKSVAKHPSRFGRILRPDGKASAKPEVRGESRLPLNIASIDTNRRTAGKSMGFGIVHCFDHDVIKRNVQFDFVRIRLNESDRSLGIVSAFGLKHGNGMFAMRCREPRGAGCHVFARTRDKG